MAAENKKNIYPDANFTLRITYGKVEGYEPRDGITYKYYTTLDGVIEKYDSTNYDFNDYIFCGCCIISWLINGLKSKYLLKNN